MSQKIIGATVGTPHRPDKLAEKLGPVLVTVNQNEDGSYTTDMTYSELVAAYNAGKTLLCLYYDDDVYLALTSRHGPFTFSAVFDCYVYQISISLGNGLETVVIFTKTDLSDISKYTLPIATPDTLGGVKPAAKTEDMTQPVGVDELGCLWSVSGGGNSEWYLAKTITLEQDVTLIVENIDIDEAINELYLVFRVGVTNAEGATGGYANCSLAINGAAIQNQPLFYRSTNNLACCHVVKKPNMLCAEWRLYANVNYGSNADMILSGAVVNGKFTDFRVGTVDQTLFFKAGGTVEVWAR